MHVSLKGFIWIPLVMFEKRCACHHVRALLHGQKVGSASPVQLCGALHFPLSIPFPAPSPQSFAMKELTSSQAYRERRVRHCFCAKRLGRDMCIFLGVRRSNDALYLPKIQWWNLSSISKELPLYLTFRSSPQVQSSSFTLEPTLTLGVNNWLHSMLKTFLEFMVLF